MTIITLATIAISFVVLIISQSLFFVGLFVLFFGAGIGAGTLARPLLLGELYSTSHYGRINSVMSFIMIFVLTISPIGTSLFVEWFGDYQIAIRVLMIVACLSIIPILKLSPGKQKVKI